MLNNSNKQSDRIYAQLSNKHDGIGDGGYVNGMLDRVSVTIDD